MPYNYLSIIDIRPTLMFHGLFSYIKEAGTFKENHSSGTEVTKEVFVKRTILITIGLSQPLCSVS